MEKQNKYDQALVELTKECLTLRELKDRGNESISLRRSRLHRQQYDRYACT